MKADSISNVDTVEFHDAFFCMATFSLGGACVVELEDISLYIKIEEELYDVWSWKGKLILSGVEHATLEVPDVDNDYLMDAKIIEQSGASIKPVTILESAKPIKKASFSFSTGATIEILASSICLELVGKGEKCDQWRGP